MATTTPRHGRITEERRRTLLRQLELQLGYDPAAPDPECPFVFDINEDRTSLDRAYDHFLELRAQFPDRVPVLVYEGRGRGKLIVMRYEDATFLRR